MVGDYPVGFTNHMFSPSNPVLADVVCRRERADWHVFAVAIDSNVAAASPGLPDAIQDYIAAHGERMSLATDESLRGKLACSKCGNNAAATSAHSRI